MRNLLAGKHQCKKPHENIRTRAELPSEQLTPVLRSHSEIISVTREPKSLRNHRTLQEMGMFFPEVN